MAPPTPAAGSPAAGDMTRLLCAGVRLDNAFAAKVIALLTDRTRFAAPAYGYDAVPVLAHALDARRLRRNRNAAVLVSVLVVFLLFLLAPVSLFGGILLVLLVSWAAVFFERLASLQVLVSKLRRGPDGGFRGEYPLSDNMSRSVLDGISAEQDTSTDLVYYGGYLPFVGAGTRVRNWSFAVLLDPAQPIGTGRTDGKEQSPEPFTVDELLGYLRERLEPVLTTESADGQRIEELQLTRRWYRKAVAERRPPVPREAEKSLRRNRNGPALYDSAREYLGVQVGSWDQELITSVFVGFDLKGRVLYTELHGHVLPPIEPRFRLVDQLPASLESSTVRSIAWQAARSVFGSVTGFPGMVFRGALKLVSPRPATVKSRPDDLTRYATGGTDYGARTSIRELAAIDGYGHFFQEIDAEKYVTIIERRVLELILDFLVEKRVDTSEYRDRQAAVLNFGILHSGSGNILNTGTQSVGSGSSASAGESSATVT